MTPDQCRADDGALAWARGAIEREKERIERMADYLDGKGEHDRAAGLRQAVWFLDRDLIGGEGCVIAAFDHRYPDVIDVLAHP